MYRLGYMTVNELLENADLYTEIVKDHDYAGEVVSEEVEIELKIYVYLPQ